MRQIAIHLPIELPPGPMARWRCDLDQDDRLSWGHGVYDLFGIERDATLDRDEVVSRYDPRSREALTMLRRHAIASGDGFSLDARIVRSSGEPRWMRVTAHVERRGDRTVALCGVKRDISAPVAQLECLGRVRPPALA